MQLVWEIVDPSLQQVFQTIRQRRRARADSWRLVALPLPLPSHKAIQLKDGLLDDKTVSDELGALSEDEEEQNYGDEPNKPSFSLQGTLYLQDAVGRHLLSLGGSGIVAPHFSHAHGCHLLRTPEAVWLVEPNLPLQAHLFLFGAGHVGRALITALAPLPCYITWVDERVEMFPASVPANVRIEVSDQPTSLLALAKPGSCFLVMTHSHQLDMQLTEAILRLPHLGWFGLIGSGTKRQLFVNRLQQRGLSEAQIEQMVCPIGIHGIKAKQPEVIAASVAAQLLQVWQERQLLP
ncbi:MAG: xanthine dehydrogenase accessory protein XdhC, partial [Burkholderiales bacterium]|nr:xanthine dehydrogenase accessory protein XdhC [Burkholderiales bacterium]